MATGAMELVARLDRLQLFLSAALLNQPLHTFDEHAGEVPDSEGEPCFLSFSDKLAIADVLGMLSQHVARSAAPEADAQHNLQRLPSDQPRANAWLQAMKESCERLSPPIATSTAQTKAPPTPPPLPTSLSKTRKPERPSSRAPPLRRLRPPSSAPLRASSALPNSSPSPTRPPRPTTPVNAPHPVARKCQHAATNLAQFLVQQAGSSNAAGRPIASSSTTPPSAPLATPTTSTAQLPQLPPCTAALQLLCVDPPPPSAPIYCTLNHKRWQIEGMPRTAPPLYLTPTTDQSVFIHNCHGCTITINHSVAAVLIDSCTNIRVACLDVIAYCQGMSCRGLSLHAGGAVSTVSFDQCQGSRLLLQPAAHHARMVTTLCTDTQVQRVVRQPGEAGGWRSLGLLKVPEQFVSVCSEHSLMTKPYRPF